MTSQWAVIVEKFSNCKDTAEIDSALNSWQAIMNMVINMKTYLKPTFAEQSKA